MKYCNFRHAYHVKTNIDTIGKDQNMFSRMIYAAFALSLAVFGLGLQTNQSSVEAAQNNQEVAIFAGGCFWCVESDFDTVAGVLSTVSGYTGGTVKNPTYKTVSAGGSGHLEAVKITFDPKQVSYAKLLYIFWRSVDPTDGGGQFCDRGDSYKTAIFTTSEKQLKTAEMSKAALEKSKVLKATIVTPIVQASAFYPSEDYHQDYYKKNPIRYKFYRYRCGRDLRVERLWGNQAHSGIKHDS
jgi:peptide-methionine (S)-S-oxide reductase